MSNMDRKNHKLIQIEVNKLETATNASLLNYGTFIYYCYNMSYKFEAGKVYGLLCECGAGAIILIPTPKLESINNIADDVIWIKDSFESVETNDQR